MDFDTHFFDEEVRCGFTLTPAHKKIWAVQLRLAALLDDICRAHDIPYFMDFGTLLGAVRHKGFVPWDIDMDFCMMRKDYARFLEAAPAHLPPEYSFQADFLHYDMVKIRDDRTTALYFPLMEPGVSQGLFIDVAPLDDVTDGPGFPDISDMQRELLLIMHNPALFLSYAKNRGGTVLPMDFITELLHTDPAIVQRQFDEFCLSHAGKSSEVANIYSYINWGGKRKRAWYREAVLLPFENTAFPAPVDYDAALTAQYGDYMTPVQRASDVEDMIFDADVPYTEYLKGGAFYDPDYWIRLGRISPEEA